LRASAAHGMVDEPRVEYPRESKAESMYGREVSLHATSRDMAEVTSAPSPEFQNDHPLSTKADDKLNRAGFAERIAGVLRGLPNGTGLVVGIHGPWGDGKTTVLNLLKGELETEANMAVVEFNPWRFTDEPSMLAGFFRMLAGVIRAKLSTRVEDLAAWIEKIGRYASVVDERIGRTGEAAGAGAEASLEDLRTRLSGALAKADKRIVILVDDIDRLDKDETHTLFRLIKACADFPNVCYVLAFDEAAVAKSIGERYGGGDEASGRAFLEKIIQIPLKLPVTLKEDLRSLCFEQVEKVLSIARVELSREEIVEFVSRFDRGISIRLDTPRAAKRYGNALMFSLPMLKGEVNTVDLMLMEALRAFYTSIYECIRANHTEFSGVESKDRRTENPVPLSVRLLDPIIEEMSPKERDAVRLLLRDLFPRGSRPALGGEHVESWTRSKRVCSPDYCPRYFAYEVSKTDVRDSEIDALLANAESGKEIEVLSTLESFFTEDKARRVIERLRHRESEINPKAVATLCLALASLASHIPNQPNLFSPGGAPSQTGILISHFINRLPPGADRVELAKRVMTAADPLWFGAECLRWLNVTENADKEDLNTLTKDEVNEVGKALVKRIKIRAEAGNPLFNVDIRQEQALLFEWWRIEGRVPVQKHLTAVFQSDPKYIGLFLQAMASRSWGQGDILPRVGGISKATLENLGLVFDLDDLATVIRENLPGDFANPKSFHDSNTPVEQRLAEQFMFHYNNWNKSDGLQLVEMEADTLPVKKDPSGDVADDTEQ